MSDALITGLISAVVSLIGIAVSSKSTRDSVTHKLDTNQQLMNSEISHIKDEMGEMKKDIKSHNNYAKLFNENIPVIKEKISMTADRIKAVEKDIRYYHKNENRSHD